MGEREGKVQMGFIITRSAGNLLCCVFVTQFWFPGQLELRGFAIWCQRVSNFCSFVEDFVVVNILYFVLFLHI